MYYTYSQASNFSRMIENEVVPTTTKAPSSSSIDESWSVVDMSSGIWPMTFELLADPVTPYLVDDDHGDQLTHQLLRNNIIYPGKFDKSGTDTLIMYHVALLEKSNKIAFHYVMDAILGYFYGLIQDIMEKDFQKEIALYIFFDGLDETSLKGSDMETITDNLLDFISSYKTIHRINLVLVLQTSGLLSNKNFISCVSSLRSSGTFAVVDVKDCDTIKDRLDIEVIPQEYRGELDCSVMDVWTNQRLQFEVFWEDCRNSYHRLQYLPSELQLISSKVRSSHSVFITRTQVKLGSHSLTIMFYFGL